MHPSSIAARNRVIWLAAVLSFLLSVTVSRAASAQAPGGDQATPAPSDPAGTAPASPGVSPGASTGAVPGPAGPAGANPAGLPGAAPMNDAANAPAGDAADAPVNLRLRRLEQQVQALKERAWRSKARVSMLKEAVLGGGMGAAATIVHVNKMGSSYRLVKLVYALDGTQIFARADDSGELHQNKELEILSGPITPGSHTLTVLAIYRGHGYGVFKYLNKYRFTVRSSHTFTVSEGNATRIEAVAFERGSVTTPLDQRPAMDFKVGLSEGAGGDASED